MNGKKNKILALVLTLVVIGVIARTTYVIAQNTAGGSYFGIMRTTEELDEDWWAEMERHMEEHWEKLEEDGDYRYCREGCH
jgi:hypothetical protein